MDLSAPGPAGLPAPSFPELAPHFDALYDLLRDGRDPDAASPMLDVGGGDGATLYGVVAGTGVHGVAVDARRREPWLGPPGFDRVLADAHALPFRDAAFAASLSLDTLEWLADPAQAVREQARVTAGPVVLVQTDWASLWFDSGDVETAQEFTRLFAGAPLRAADPQAAATVARGSVRLATVHTIRGDRLQPGTYALHLLTLLRRWLVRDAGVVRARRFDDWRAELAARAAEDRFAFSLTRRVVVAEGAGTRTR